MDADPGQVIRSLRLALDMSQAEFARAAGWSPSTISSWERGRAKPSRLALKTILAFAEERGVRYRPRSAATTALVPMASRPDLSDGYAGMPGPRPALRPLVYADPATSTSGTSAGTPRALDVRTSWEREAHAAASPPRWSAEASFRVTLGARSSRDRALPRGVIEGAIVVAAFLAAFTLREPVRRLLGHDTAATAVAAPRGDAQAATAPVLASVRAVAPRRAVEPANVPEEQESTAPAAVAQIAPAKPALARLESVIAIGDAARATFRTANDAVTVERGDWVGALQVATIASDGVTLVDRAGTIRRVRVGQHTPLE